MNATAPRLIVVLLSVLLSTCLLAPATAPAASGGKARAAGKKLGLGNARVAKRGKSQQARATQNRKRQTAEAANAAPPADNPEILFRGDFDSGFDRWHVQSLSYRASLLSSGALQGSQAARFEVQSGDVEPETGSQRSEVSGPTFDEGQDLYIRDAIRLPSSNAYSAPWMIIQQLHEEDWGGSPGMAVMLDKDRSISLGAGDSSNTFWESAPLAADRWYDLIYRVNLSQDPSAGFVEVWLDGAQQSLENGQKRLYGQTIQATQTYLKAGIYRSKSSSGTSVVEHDAILVGTSYAAVAAG
ncbi:MAG: heparin lyase I family protein [Solirubrobacterales bacterium]